MNVKQHGIRIYNIVEVDGKAQFAPATKVTAEEFLALARLREALLEVEKRRGPLKDHSVHVMNIQVDDLHLKGQLLERFQSMGISGEGTIIVNLDHIMSRTVAEMASEIEHELTHYAKDRHDGLFLEYIETALAASRQFALSYLQHPVETEERVAYVFQDEARAVTYFKSHHELLRQSLAAVMEHPHYAGTALDIADHMSDHAEQAAQFSERIAFSDETGKAIRSFAETLQSLSVLPPLQQGQMDYLDLAPPKEAAAASGKRRSLDLLKFPIAAREEYRDYFTPLESPEIVSGEGVNHAKESGFPKEFAVAQPMEPTVRKVSGPESERFAQTFTDYIAPLSEQLYPFMRFHNNYRRAAEFRADEKAEPEGMMASLTRFFQYSPDYVKREYPPIEPVTNLEQLLLYHCGADAHHPSDRERLKRLKDRQPQAMKER